MMRGNQTTSTQTVQVASGTDRSGAVLVLGIGLLVVNGLFGGPNGSAGPLMQVFRGGTLPDPSVWGPYLLGFLAVFLLLMLAKAGEAAGNVAVLFLVAVWIVWLLNKPAPLAKILGQSINSSTKKGA